MKAYLVKLKPLEPYTFKQAVGFSYGRVRWGSGRKYRIDSSDFPDQITLFNLTRRLILTKQGIWQSDGKCTPEEKIRSEETVGLDSWELDGWQIDCGNLRGISPLFLLNNKDEVLVPNPYHNKSSIIQNDANIQAKGFCPIQMSEDEYLTSKGRIHLPLIGEYNAKRGHGTGYFNLETTEIYTDLFVHAASIEPYRVDGDPYDRVLDRVSLSEGYSLCYIVYTEAALPEETTERLGEGYSAFVIHCIPIEQSEGISEAILEEKIRHAFRSKQGKWYYAWSDLYNNHRGEWATGLDYYMLEIKTIKGIYNNYVIRSGSVYYLHAPLISDDNAWSVGMNRLIEL